MAIIWAKVNKQLTKQNKIPLLSTLLLWVLIFNIKLCDIGIRNGWPCAVKPHAEQRKESEGTLDESMKIPLEPSRLISLLGHKRCLSLKFRSVMKQTFFTDVLIIFIYLFKKHIFEWHWLKKTKSLFLLSLCSWWRRHRKQEATTQSS